MDINDITLTTTNTSEMELDDIDKFLADIDMDEDLSAQLAKINANDDTLDDLLASFEDDPEILAILNEKDEPEILALLNEDKTEELETKNVATILEEDVILECLDGDKDLCVIKDIKFRLQNMKPKDLKILADIIGVDYNLLSNKKILSNIESFLISLDIDGLETIRQNIDLIDESRKTEEKNKDLIDESRKTEEKNKIKIFATKEKVISVLPDDNKLLSLKGEQFRNKIEKMEREVVIEEMGNLDRRELILKLGSRKSNIKNPELKLLFKKIYPGSSLTSLNKPGIIQYLVSATFNRYCEPPEYKCFDDKGNITGEVCETSQAVKNNGKGVCVQDVNNMFKKNKGINSRIINGVKFYGNKTSLDKIATALSGLPLSESKVDIINTTEGKKVILEETRKPVIIIPGESKESVETIDTPVSPNYIPGSPTFTKEYVMPEIKISEEKISEGCKDKMKLKKLDKKFLKKYLKYYDIKQEPRTNQEMVDIICSRNSKNFCDTTSGDPDKLCDEDYTCRVISDKSGVCIPEKYSVTDAWSPVLKYYGDKEQVTKFEKYLNNISENKLIKEISKDEDLSLEPKILGATEEKEELEVITPSPFFDPLTDPLYNPLYKNLNNISNETKNISDESDIVQMLSDISKPLNKSSDVITNRSQQVIARCLGLVS